MAIALLNEMSYTENSITCDVISAHCKPIIYFSATTTAATSVITLTIDGEDLVINGLLIDSDVSYTYWIADIDQLLKYFMVNNGITDEFEILTDGIDTSAITGSMNINIETFTSVPASIDDDDFTVHPSHLWHDIPQASGFNLWDVLTLKNTFSQKWCNDTYNALYVHNAGLALDLVDGEGEFVQVTRSTSASFELSQFKFTKKVQNVYDLREQVVVHSISPFDLGNEIITYTGAKTVLASAIMSPAVAGNGLDSAQLIVTGKYITDTDVTEYAQLTINYTTGSPDTTTSYLSAGDGKKDIHISIDVDKTRILSSVVATPLGYTGTPSTTRKVMTEDIRMLLEYDNDANVAVPSGEAVLANGINRLTINPALAEADTTFEAALAIEIEFDSSDKYVPLVWFHQSMGFVSYAFEGLEIEGIETKRREDIDLYFNTLADVNGLKNSLGKECRPKITLTTQADKKYWPLLKDLYVNRKVYLYVGKYGDADDATKWLKVDVDGEYEINNNTNRSSAIFSVELTLPKQLNAQY